MPALTTEFDSEVQPGEILSLPVKADAVIYAGSIVAVDANGLAVPASDTANLKVVGRAEETKDATGLASSAIAIQVRRSPFWVNNDATNPIVAARLYMSAYVKDDNSVAVAGGPANDIVAGRVLQIDATQGVLIDPRDIPLPA